MRKKCVGNKLKLKRLTMKIRMCIVVPRGCNELSNDRTKCQRVDGGLTKEMARNGKGRNVLWFNKII